MTEETVYSDDDPGPTQCDEKRLERDSDLKSVSEIIPDKMKLDTEIMWGDVHDLLLEAMSCYQNGAYLATAVMCRIAAESGVYVAVSRPFKIGRTDYLPTISMSIDYNFRDARRKEIFRLAREKGVMNQDIEEKARWVISLGDFGAHFGQRIDKEVFDSVTKDAAERFWVSRKEALKALDNTASILKFFMSKVAHENHERLGLGDIMGDDD